MIQSGMTEWDEIRRDFPALTKHVYLDSAATGPLLRPVRETVEAFYREIEAEGDDPWSRWLERREVARAAVARLVLEGYDYPGLHSKALKGMGGLWSIRAGEPPRVYLTRDGDVVRFEGAATREEQPTYLRKKRD